MNILFLMKVYEIGGQEVVTSTLANYFIKHGHRVSIACFKSPNPEMVKRTNPIIKFYTIGEYKYSRKNIIKLKTILEKEQINLVINQWGLPYIPAKVLYNAQKNIRLKTIAVYHNSPDSNARIKEVEIEISQAKNILVRWLLHYKKYIYQLITSLSMRYVYNHSDLYMILSPSFIEKFKRFTRISNLSKLVVLTNPLTINTDNYIYSAKNKQKEIIYVGRIDYNQKRVNRIIDIWKELEDKFPDWKLSIIGDGPYREKIEQQTKELNLSQVYFEGFKKPEIYYKRASILLLTSEYEGFPLVLAECMSYGVVPVVYGSYSAVYDIIENNINGIIVQPQNGTFNKFEMTHHLSLLMNNNKQRNNMAQEAIQTCKQKYSIEAIYQSWERIFNQLVQ